MILFLALYFLIYGLLHVYLFLHFKWAMSPGHYVATGAAIWMVFMILAPVLTRLCEKNGFFTTARVLAWTGYSWLGFLFLMIVMLIALDIWNLCALAVSNLNFLNLTPPLLSGRNVFPALILLSLALWSYGFTEAHNLKVERIHIETGKMVSESGRLRIAQVSDIHLGHIVGTGWLSKVAEAIRDEKPDLVVATGDVVDALMKEPPALVEIWKRVTPPLGKIAVMGNHEFYSGVREADSFLKDAGFSVLRGRALPVGNYLEVAGVDDPAGRSTEGSDNTNEKNLFSNPDGRFRLLLKHRPRIGAGGATAFDLQLSGHLHKGQIFPFNLFIDLFYPMHSGLFEFPGGSQLYVSRGTGTWGPPIRIGAPPEITVIDIFGRPSVKDIP